MKTLTVTIFFIGFTLATLGQPYIDGKKTRHRFAQLNIGISTNLISGKGSKTYSMASSSLMEEKQMSSFGEANIVFGGTHFWGKADFFIAIPIVRIGKSSLKSGVETGGRYFFRRLSNKKISPYLGASFHSYAIKFGTGGTLERFYFPLQTGIYYLNKKMLVTAGFSYQWNTDNHYYFTENNSLAIKVPPISVNVGIKWMIETTLSAEKDWISGRTKTITDTLAKLNRLNGLTIAVGPSSAFFIKRSSYNTNARPFLYQHKSTQLFPEFGIGYYMHRNDIQFNFAYRKNLSRIEGFDFSQKIIRESFALETYKFFADYHGFVPFIGPSISREDLSFTESGNGLPGSLIVSKNLVRPGLVFGWDIRPNRLQSFLLRTNLRWVPNLNVKINNKGSINFDQLELNFIQLVIFPGRLLK